MWVNRQERKEKEVRVNRGRKESNEQRKKKEEAGVGGRKQGLRERWENTDGFKHTLKLPIHTRNIHCNCPHTLEKVSMLYIHIHILLSRFLHCESQFLRAKSTAKTYVNTCFIFLCSYSPLHYTQLLDRIILTHVLYVFKLPLNYIWFVWKVLH